LNYHCSNVDPIHCYGCHCHCDCCDLNRRCDLGARCHSCDYRYRWSDCRYQSRGWTGSAHLALAHSVAERAVANLVVMREDSTAAQAASFLASSPDLGQWWRLRKVKPPPGEKPLAL
jgi:hypothetical protein